MQWAFDPKLEKSECGATLEFLGAAVRFAAIRDERQVHLSLSAPSVRKLTEEIVMILEQKVLLAQMRKIVAELNFAQASVTDRVERVALRPLYDLVLRRGDMLAARVRWACLGGSTFPQLRVLSLCGLLWWPDGPRRGGAWPGGPPE